MKKAILTISILLGLAASSRAGVNYDLQQTASSATMRLRGTMYPQNINAETYVGVKRIVSLKDYGAIDGDSASNETTNNTAIQNWINAIDSGAEGYISTGTFRFNATITKTGFLSISGSGRGSDLKYTGSGNAIELTGPRFSRLSNFLLEGTGAATGGLKVVGAQEGLRLDQVYIERFAKIGASGLIIDDSWDLSVVGGAIRQNYNGIETLQTTGVGSVNDLSIIDVDMANSSGTAIIFRQGINLYVKGIDCTQCARGIAIASGVVTGLVKSVIIENNYFEGSMAFAVSVGSGAAPALINSIRDIQIRGNYLSNDTGNMIQLDMVKGVVLLNNLWGAVTAGYNRVYASTNTLRVLLIDTSSDSSLYADDNIRDNSSDGIKMFSNRRTQSGDLSVPGGNFSVGQSTIYAAGGAVGIGTTAPATMLDVNGNIFVSGANLLHKGGLATFNIGNDGAAGGLALVAGSTAKMTIPASGSSWLSPSAAVVPTLNVGNDYGSGDLGLVAGSSARASLTHGGFFGVGTSTPATTLEVNGNAQFGSGVNKSTFSTTGDLTLAAGGNLTQSGANGYYVGKSSVNASAFFGDGSKLTGITGATETVNASMLGVGTVANPFGVSAASVAVLSGGFVDNNKVDGSSITKMGNGFNGASQLVKLDASGRLGVGTTNPSSGIEIAAASMTITGAGRAFAVGSTTNTLANFVANSSGTFMLGTTAGGTSAPALYVGEFISTNTASTITPVTSGDAITLATTTLSAGVWAVYGSCFEDIGATTAQTRQWCSVSSTANGQDSTQSDAHQQRSGVPSVNGSSSINLGPRIVVITGPTAYYLTGLIVYSVLGGATWSTKSTLRAIRIR